MSKEKDEIKCPFGYSEVRRHIDSYCDDNKVECIFLIQIRELRCKLAALEEKNKKAYALGYDAGRKDCKADYRIRDDQ